MTDMQSDGLNRRFVPNSKIGGFPMIRRSHLDVG